MGETTYVREMPTARRAEKKRQPMRFEINALLLISILGLLVIGLLAVFSSSWEFSFNLDPENRSIAYTILSQLRWVVVGLGVGIFLTLTDYHKMKSWALPIMGITVLVLITLIFLGVANADGPVRAFKEGSGQPSELAKLVIIIYLAVWLCSKRDQLNQLTLGVFPLMVIVGLTAVLIMAQPDFSAAITVVFLGALLFYLAGSDLKQIVLLLLITAVLAVAAVTLSDTVKERLTIFINGLLNPDEAGYHAKRAMAAISRGGIFGVGIGKGTAKYNKGVPVAWTDSIFVVIAEEAGMIGALIVVGLYILLLYEGLRVARNAPDLLGQLLAAGITLWIGFEALVNIAGLMNLAPVAGNALPLISMGGSSMITTLAGLGILMNISRQTSFTPKTPEGRSYSAVVDLRGRDRRGSVSRRRRSSRDQRR